MEKTTKALDIFTALDYSQAGEILLKNITLQKVEQLRRENCDRGQPVAVNHYTATQEGSDVRLKLRLRREG